MNNICLNCNRSKLIYYPNDNKISCSICNTEVYIESKEKNQIYTSLDNKITHFKNMIKELTNTNISSFDIYDEFIEKMKNSNMSIEEIDCMSIQKWLTDKNVNNYIIRFSFVYRIIRGVDFRLSEKENKLCLDIFIKFINYSRYFNKRNMNINYGYFIGMILDYFDITNIFRNSIGKNFKKNDQNHVLWRNFIIDYKKNFNIYNQKSNDMFDENIF